MPLKLRPAVLLPCILAASLITGDSFGSPGLTAYFLSVFFISVLAFLTGIYFLRKPIPFGSSGIYFLVLLLLLLIYYSGNSWLRGQELNLRHGFLAANILLFAATYALSRAGAWNPSSFYRIIVAFAAVESAICGIQFAGWMESANPLFAVTGTWANPNVTALFLAMAFPLALAGALEKGRGLPKLLHVAATALVIAALFLLQCRTAFLGAAIATVIVVNARYPLRLLWQAMTTKRRYALAIAAPLLVIAILSGLYYAKPASATGRLLIWKIASHLVARHPFAGVGYGFFERDYNLEQAAYFGSGHASPAEINNAAYVHTAYNELLENLIEGGIPGLLLFIAPFIILIRSQKTQTAQQPQTAALYAGIAAWLLMSLVNFTVQAIPATCLLMLYAAALLATTEKRETSQTPEKPKIILRIPIPTLFILSALCLATTQWPIANAFRTLHKMQLTATNERRYPPLHSFAALEKHLANDDQYWIGYGRTLLYNKQYASAVKKLNIARAATANPAIYMLLGDSYAHLNDYARAYTAYETAQNMLPHRLGPCYALMKLSQRKNDTAGVLREANKLLAMTPPTTSPKADHYRQEAQQLLQTYNNYILH